jgi:hypothetical protein
VNSVEFVRESNRIEGIVREPTKAEVAEFLRFMGRDVIIVDDLVRFVSVYQPNAVLRDKETVPGVRVGSHVAPPSGPAIRRELEGLLMEAEWPVTGSPMLWLRALREG